MIHSVRLICSFHGSDPSVSRNAQWIVAKMMHPSQDTHGHDDSEEKLIDGKYAHRCTFKLFLCQITSEETSCNAFH